MQTTIKVEIKETLSKVVEYTVSYSNARTLDEIKENIREQVYGMHRDEIIVLTGDDSQGTTIEILED